MNGPNMAELSELAAHFAATLHNMAPRCGDHVLHRPSGEKWIVAFADQDRDELSPAGWPDSLAKLSDCDVVKRCSDIESAEWMMRWLEKPESNKDTRARRIVELYGMWLLEFTLRHYGSMLEPNYERVYSAVVATLRPVAP